MWNVNVMIWINRGCHWFWDSFEDDDGCGGLLLNGHPNCESTSIMTSNIFKKNIFLWMRNKILWLSIYDLWFFDFLIFWFFDLWKNNDFILFFCCFWKRKDN